MRTFKYVLIYLLIIQFALYYIVPLDMVYGYRMDYELVKNNIHNIDTILEQISKEVKNKDLKEYVIILGDSVAFSGPGDSQQSIGYYLEEINREKNGENAIRFFNLSMPAMQVGDIYTMLLKLDKYGISTDNVILNITYAGFVKRDPDPPIVFWFRDNLKNMDQESYAEVQVNLTANDYSKGKKNFVSYLSSFLESRIYPSLRLFQYKDFLKKAVSGEHQSDALGDARVWSEKEGLRELLKEYEYQGGFSAKPFDMSTTNPQIYFLEKIMERQQDKNTLIFLAAVNEVLMEEEVNKDGYQENLKKIDNYFRIKDSKYLNLQGKIGESSFSDHIHLTSEGYRMLAEILYEELLVTSD